MCSIGNKSYYSGKTAVCSNLQINNLWGKNTRLVLQVCWGEAEQQNPKNPASWIFSLVLNLAPHIYLGIYNRQVTTVIAANLAVISFTMVIPIGFPLNWVLLLSCYCYLFPWYILKSGATVLRVYKLTGKYRKTNVVQSTNSHVIQFTLFIACFLHLKLSPLR